MTNCNLSGRGGKESDTQGREVRGIFILAARKYCKKKEDIFMCLSKDKSTASLRNRRGRDTDCSDH